MGCEVRALELSTGRDTLLTAASSDNHAIVDSKERLIAYLVGSPRKDPGWPSVNKAASAFMKDVVKDCDFDPDDLKHSRGHYPTLSTGFSFGGGPLKPHNIRINSAKQEHVIEKLVHHPSFVRYSGTCNGTFESHSPRLYRHCNTFLWGIQEADPELRKPFENSVYPATTFNFGPQAATFPHRDSQNIPYGWCAVTALGDYDYTLGGHLVLWDLKLVIEFPPGSTILIPSAVLTHSNTPVQDGETRQSFTQWCSGSLLRWWTYGLRTEKTLAREAPVLATAFRKAASSRWEEVLGYFSTLSELKSDLKASACAD
ncbi:hypothetical protein FA95DRAFT_1506120 [Auriscalpium vulgare]|uniref:Uncharacterized protein n=1 Tax=Auriscalpium vulgare TaxID=40419 RepID=A0ACB8R2A5_9AGAM|nr:hypothetical protein FA95DRAFT_1506120 [Auriscalpium vulgare]